MDIFFLGWYFLLSYGFGKNSKLNFGKRLRMNFSWRFINDSCVLFILGVMGWWVMWDGERGEEI